MDFDQTCTDTYLGQRKGMIKFSLPLPDFQGHQDHITKKSCVGVGVAFCLKPNLLTG